MNTEYCNDAGLNSLIIAPRKGKNESVLKHKRFKTGSLKVIKVLGATVAGVIVGVKNKNKFRVYNYESQANSRVPNKHDLSLIHI